MNSEAIYAALYAMSENLAWSPGGALQYRSRRVRTWDKLPAQPALCQAQRGMNVVWRTSLDAIRTLNAAWLIYHQVGKDTEEIPSVTSNAIIASVWDLFTQDTDGDGNKHLAINVGLPQGDSYVYRAWIEGRIDEYPGDLDGQTLIVVPIKILIP